ncbi:helix-turn-helix domain-containing protein [Streptosporangium sp. CA-135522]|uniref:helix-turn-helix domain-containing protein n=1 Tax=Streptosporangium sp. CA-135522 TaxID=3240072 RepID=UPI003D8F46D2
MFCNDLVIECKMRPSLLAMKCSRTQYCPSDRQTRRADRGRQEANTDAGSRLIHQDRRHIAGGLAEGLTYTEITRRLDRPISTIRREVLRNGGADGHQADRAHQATEGRARRRDRYVIDADVWFRGRPASARRTPCRPTSPAREPNPSAQPHPPTPDCRTSAGSSNTPVATWSRRPSNGDRSLPRGGRHRRP